MSNCSVSVVIPVFNAESVLREAVESVVGQSHSPLEIILVNDGSTDTSAEVCAHLAREHASIVVLTQCNKGASAARNAGIAVAKGEFVAFLDADDVWHPSKLERQIDYLTRVGCAALITSVWVADKALKVQYLARKPYEGVTGLELARLLLLNKIFMCTPTLLVRRQLLLELGGFNCRLKRREDHELLIRLAMSGELQILDEPLVYRREMPDSLSSRGDAIRLYRAHLRFFAVVSSRFADTDIAVAVESAQRIAMKVAVAKGDVGGLIRLIVVRLRSRTLRPTDFVWLGAVFVPRSAQRLARRAIVMRRRRAGPSRAVVPGALDSTLNGG